MLKIITFMLLSALGAGCVTNPPPRTSQQDQDYQEWVQDRQYIRSINRR